MVRALKIRALFSDFAENKAEDEKLIDTVNEIYNVLALYKTEDDEKKKAAYKITVDELEKYKFESPEIWMMIEEKYELLTAEA